MMSRRLWWVCSFGLAWVAWSVCPVASGEVDPAEGWVASSTVSLDGDQWLIARDPDNVGRDETWFAKPNQDAKSTYVPSIIQQAFPRYHGVAWYWREFTAAANPHPGGRYLLKFWSVDYLADVWVNGVHVGAHEGGDGRFILDATDAIKPGAANLLSVRVLNPPADQIIDGIVLNQTAHASKGVWCWNDGGIEGPVELLIVPSVWVEDVHIVPDPKSGDVAVHVSVHNSAQETVACRVGLWIAPAESGSRSDATEMLTQLPPGTSTVDGHLHVDQFRLWQLDDPRLYRVNARVRVDGASSFDEYVDRCGFRDFRIVDGFFCLNGKRVLLKGAQYSTHLPVNQCGGDLRERTFFGRDELVKMKASGFNMVRILTRAPRPAQVQLCDELGLMIYSESLASWFMQDSPQLAERWNRALKDVITRERNHPSVVMWGLQNENTGDAVFDHSVRALQFIRTLDETRPVLLNSGRFDRRPEIGSASNPGGDQWEYVWGAEGPNALDRDAHPGWCGDVHDYCGGWYTPDARANTRSLGKDAKPVFISEYGIPPNLNLIREIGMYEQHRVDYAEEMDILFRPMQERFHADWQFYGMDRVYPFPADFLRESQHMNARARQLGFDLVRSNPQVCGLVLTGLLDGLCGEGIWSLWREWHPGMADVLQDGWAPLKWCLFVSPTHVYAGQPVKIEAILANEDALAPGEYPAIARIVHTATGTVVWEKNTTVRVPAPADGKPGPLAIPVIHEDLTIDGPAGTYQAAVCLTRGGAPTGGRVTFWVSEEPAMKVRRLTLWDADEATRAWLVSKQVAVRSFEDPEPEEREIILVGNVSANSKLEDWRELMRRVSRGSQVIVLSPAAFRRDNDPVGWLPLVNKGKFVDSFESIWTKDCVAKTNPIFDGLQAGGIVDPEYYGPLIHRAPPLQVADHPQESPAVTFAVGNPEYDGFYTAGLLIGVYPFGEGRFVLNTLHVAENLGKHPAADRLLANMIEYLAADLVKPLAPAPADLDAKLKAVGYE
ncbi:MAG: hypothetical protein GXY58_15985 [Planctomycetaceae bacterium]|nr:hypothetical protein [Planctomycetaceae bacterium]